MTLETMTQSVHPNICKGGPAWICYCRKTCDYICNQPKGCFWAEALACKSVPAGLKVFMDNDHQSYLKFAGQIEANLRRAIRAAAPTLPRNFGPYHTERFPHFWTCACAATAALPHDSRMARMVML